MEQRFPIFDQYSLYRHKLCCSDFYDTNNPQRIPEAELIKLIILKSWIRVANKALKRISSSNKCYRTKLLHIVLNLTSTNFYFTRIT